MADFTRGPANVDNLLATTLQEYRDTMTEQWVSNNVLLKFMEKEAKEPIDGGVSIIEHLEYDDSDTVGWVGRTDSVSVAENEFLTQARFVWATIAGAVSIYDHDLAKNMGKNQLFSLMEAKLRNVQRTFDDKLERALLAASTANANTINTLYDIVDSSDPSLAALGDIARASYNWWQATETASGSMATQGLENIRTASNTVSRSGMDPVNLHLTTQTIYEAYQARLTPFERFTSNGKGDLEFDSLAFANKPVVYSFAAQSGTWLGINTKYLRFRINKHMNFLQQPFVRGEGKQYKSAIVQTMCQLTTTRPKSMFKLTSVTA
jgi:hypothetical protein